MATLPRVVKSTAPFESEIRSMETSHETILMLRAKIVVVGDAYVGKTAVVQMLKSGGHDYPKNYIMVSLSVELILSVVRYAIP